MYRKLAVVVAIGIGISACTGSQTTAPSPTSTEFDLVTTTPQAVGDVERVVWDIPKGEPFTLDWIQSYNYPENTVVSNMCESLLRMNPDFSLSPGLARQVSNPSPTRWVFDIRDGVEFWDGKLLTAEDVVFSLRRNLESASYWNLWYSNVESINQTDSMEVTVELRQPDYIFNEIMATAGGAVGQKDFVTSRGKTYGTSEGGVMCTGPFEFGKWVSGDSLTLSRNDEYWDETNRAHAQEFEFRFITDPPALTNALLGGQIDGAYGFSVTSMSALQNDGVGTVFQGPSLTGEQIVNSATEGPFTEPLVREALSLAIDRDGITSTVFGGAAAPLRTIASPSTWGYGKEVFQAAYNASVEPTADLNRARELVDQAGSPQETIVFAVLPGGEHQQVANIVQAAATDIGLNVRIEVLPPNEFNSLLFDPKAREGISGWINSWYSDVADPLEEYVTFALPSSPYNYNGYSNDVVTDALNRARRTANPNARADLVVDAQTQLMKDLDWIPIADLSNLLFMNDRITGAPASFAYIYSPWAASVGAS